MADRIYLSNDTNAGGFGGVHQDEETFHFNWANESSSHVVASISTLQPIFTAKANGRIVDFWIGVTAPATSASGFVSGTTSANFRINSALGCSTMPAILLAGSAGQAVRITTNNTILGNAQSAVVNTASAAFSAGDQISFDYTTQSGGSAAAGAAGSGLRIGFKVRYNAA